MANLIFLRANNAKLRFKREDLEHLMIDLAAGKITKNQLACFLEFGRLSEV